MERQTKATHRELAALLTQHFDEIADTWAVEIFQHASFHPVDNWFDIVLLSTKRGIQFISDALLSGSYDGLEDYLNELSLVCLRSGFECGEATQSLLLFKKAVQSQITLLDAELALEIASELDACLIWMVKRFVDLYTTETTRRLRNQHERKQTLLRSTLQMSNSLALNEVLQQSARSIVIDLATECCDCYLVDENHSLLIPELSMNKHLASTDTVQLYWEYPFNPSSDKFLKQALKQKDPLVCYDVQQDSRINKQMLKSTGIKSILAVPLEVHNQILGLLVTGMFSEHREFTEEQVELARDIARNAELAIENLKINDKRTLENQSVQRVLSVLLQEFELEEVLKVICTEMLLLTGAQNSAIYFVDDEKWLTYIQGTGNEPYLKRIQLADALSGRALATGEILLSNDPTKDSRFFPKVVDLKNILIAPLRIDEKPLAVLYASNKPQDFTEDDIRIVGVFADQVAMAIEYARLIDNARYIATLEERGRLAREIHDNLAQALSILKLQASHTSELLLAGQSEQALSSLQEMKQAASEANIDAREAIFNLRNQLSSTADFLATVKAHLDKYRQSYDIDVHLDAQFGSVSETISIQVIRIIQEALANVRKHAKANTVWVRLHETEAQLTVTVEDDGQGFDYRAVQQTAHGSGVGLQVMQERLASLGGHLEIKTMPHQGTYIVAYIPLVERK